MICAIDPGTVQSGIVIVSSDMEKILFAGKLENEKIMEILDDPVPFMDVWCRQRYGKELFFDFLPSSFQVAIEMIASYGMPVGREVFQTCVWTGRFQQKALEQHYPVEFVYRREEKLLLCQSVKARDCDIRKALIRLFGEPGTKKNPGFFYGFHDDMWAAFAVAYVIYKRQK